MSKEQEEQGFRVTDRRLYREDGERREDAGPDQPAADKAANGAKPGAPSEPGPSQHPDDAERIDFPSYVLSYYTQGLVLLGEVPNPYTHKTEADPEAARHTVDILTLLQEKTRGNLTKEEDQLLESVLYELRLKYMAKTKRINL
jgi:hypothetical protein